MEYADEPRLVFSPLSEKDYCDFYALEMNSFADDADFYLSIINKKYEILELGCGNGRLTRILAKRCKHITGVDLSSEMLRRARLHMYDNISYHHMNMLDFSLNSYFDAIVIPYNTLNLLKDNLQIKKCLQLCRKHLKDEGQLLFQVYHPDEKMKDLGDDKLFQFAIFKRDNGDTVVKETIRSYSSIKRVTSLVERYRDRPLMSRLPNRDLRQSLELYTPDLQEWINIVEQCQFQIIECYGDYDGTTFSEQNDTTLFIHAEVQVS